MVSTSVRSPAASSGSKRRLKIGFTTPKFKPNRRSRSFPSCQETQNTRVQILGYVLQKKTLLNDLFLSKCMAASWAGRVGRRGGTGGGQNCQMRVWCDVEWLPTAQRTGIDDCWVSHKTDFSSRCPRPVEEAVLLLRSEWSKSTIPARMLLNSSHESCWIKMHRIACSSRLRLIQSTRVDVPYSRTTLLLCGCGKSHRPAIPYA